MTFGNEIYKYLMTCVPSQDGNNQYSPVKAGLKLKFLLFISQHMKNTSNLLGTQLLRH